MKSPLPVKKKLQYLTAVLLLLPSCTIVDTGGAVDNIGKEVPVCADSAVPGHKKVASTPIYSTPDGKHYAKLEVSYQPARTKWFRCFMVGGGPVYLHDHFDSTQQHEDEKNTWYAELSYTKPSQVVRLIPAADFDLSQATYTHKRLTMGAVQKLVQSHFPEQRSGLNTALQPVRWVAEVADVPLSIVATPINWLVMLTGHNLWKL